MNPQLSYRLANLNDVTSLKQLGLLTYGKYKNDLDDESWQKMYAFLNDENTYLKLLDAGKGFVCEADNKPVGMAFIVAPGTAHPLFNPEWAQVRMVGVDGQFSGNGIGKQLTQLCIDEAKQKGHETLALHTSEMQQPAMSIYEKLGFSKHKTAEVHNKEYWILTMNLKEKISYHVAETGDDAQTLASLRLEFALELSAPHPQEEEVDKLRTHLLEYFTRATKDQSCISVIATVNGTAAGIGTLHLRDMPGSFRNPTGKWAYVMNMYTRPQFRKRGICAGVLNKLVDEGKSAGYTAFELHATAAGEPVYLANGFKIHEEPTLRRILGRD